MNSSRKSKLIFIIPVVLAVFVVTFFAFSGNITKKSDVKNPTEITKQVQTTKEAETEKIINSSVTIFAVGDNLIHNTLISSGEKSDGTRDYTGLYANMKEEISQADIAVIDQETILGGDSFELTGYPVFNSPWEIGEAAIDAGFDVFNCATNHTMDKGWDGIAKELEFFDNHKSVVALGINHDENKQITYYEKNDIKFAMLNYTYGTNGIPLPQDKPWCVNLLEKEAVANDIKQARANADVVIVFPHWGTEYSFGISQEQEEYTKMFSELGVDIVIGCHPHVIEPVKWVTNEQTGHKMIIYYSLGNFISHQIDPENLLGGIAKLTVEKHGDDITISSAKFVPIVTHYKRGASGKFEFNVYKLTDYTDELGYSHSQNGITKSNLSKFVNDVIEEEFLDDDYLEMQSTFENEN